MMVFGRQCVKQTMKNETVEFFLSTNSQQGTKLTAEKTIFLHELFV